MVVRGDRHGARKRHPGHKGARWFNHLRVLKDETTVSLHKQSMAPDPHERLHVSPGVVDQESCSGGVRLPPPSKQRADQIVLVESIRVPGHLGVLVGGQGDHVAVADEIPGSDSAQDAADKMGATDDDVIVHFALKCGDSYGQAERSAELHSLFF